MKVFLRVLLAILAAAAVIVGFKFCSDSYSELAAGRRRNELLKEQADAMKRQAGFYNQMREKEWQRAKNQCDARHNAYAHSTLNAADFDKLSNAEKEHFYQCSRCGEFVDKRELRDVIFHETDHKPKSYIPRIIGKPIHKRRFSC